MIRPSALLVVLAGVLGATGVADAAVAAHVAGGAMLEKAALILMVHGAALLGLAALVAQSGERTTLAVAAAALGLGAALFGLDVGLAALRGTHVFPYAAPIGGSTMIAAWLVVGLLALAGHTRPRDGSRRLRRSADCGAAGASLGSRPSISRAFGVTPMTIRPRRSVLYMPGSNARALEKAKTLSTDAVILDLEDSVAPDAKLQARDQVVAVAKAGGFGPREVVIRVNSLAGPWGMADLEAAAAVAPDAVLIPKVSKPEDVYAAAAVLDLVGAPESVKIWAMFETPLAVLNAGAIAAAAATPEGRRLSVFVLGTNDLAKETRARFVADRAPMLAWLTTAVAAGRAYGLDVIDGVYNNLSDAEGFLAECEQGRDLGMDGKTLIHPNQLEGANRVFSPSEAEVAQAEKILAAFALPENASKGVISLDGRMVERLHAEMAERTVAIARAIAAAASA